MKSTSQISVKLLFVMPGMAGITVPTLVSILTTEVRSGAGAGAGGNTPAPAAALHLFWYKFVTCT